MRLGCQDRVSEGKIYENQFWSMNDRTVRGKGRCNDSRIIEVKHCYQEAVRKDEVIPMISNVYQSLQEQLVVNYAPHYFNAQYCEKQVQILIRSICSSFQSHHHNTDSSVDDCIAKRNQLKTLITCLFAFIRIEQETKSSHFQTLRQWLIQLISMLLTPDNLCINSQEDRMFLLQHVMRCPAGISDWGIAFVQADSPLDADTPETAINNMNNCLHMMHTILSPVR